MINNIVSSVKSHKPEVFTALLTGTTVAGIMYISNARTVQKTAMQITQGVLKESEDTFQRRLESQIANTNDENERSMGRLKKLHEEEVVGLKAAVAQAVADLNSQKLAFDTLKGDNAELERQLRDKEAEIEEVRRQEKDQFDRRLSTQMQDGDSRLKESLENLRREHTLTIEELRTAYQEQIKSMKESYELQLSHMKDQISKNNSACAIQVDSLQLKVGQLNQQLEQFKALAYEYEQKIVDEAKLHVATKEQHDILIDSHKAFIENMKADHQCNVLELKKAHEKVVKESNEKLAHKEVHISTLEAKHEHNLKLKEEELLHLKKQHDFRLKETHEKHRDDIENIKRIQDGEMKLKLKQHDEHVNDLRSRIDSHVLSKDEEIQRLKKLHEEHISHLSARHEEVVDQMQERHVKQKESVHKELQKAKNVMDLHADESATKEEQIRALLVRIESTNKEKDEAIRDLGLLEKEKAEAEVNFLSERKRHGNEKSVLIKALDESRDENKKKQKEIEKLNIDIQSKLESIKALEENSRRDARKSVESVKKLQLMRKETEAKIKAIQDQHELEIAEQAKSYSNQLLNLYSPVRLEDETNPEARCALFIAMLLAGSTICTGPGQISERRLITFLEQVNSPLFSNAEDASDLASQLINELNSVDSFGRKNRFVQVSQFAEYILSKLSHHPTSLDKLRTIALASYLKLGSSPRNSPVKTKSKAGQSMSSRSARKEYK